VHVENSSRIEMRQDLIAANINIILVVTGALTLGAALVFFAPGLVL
jgi:hypothetical protein